ncbi:MAG: GGDEF domain-containing protein [Arhodomonas sp.]|nr:GGDEF domain-containing protein [Arhodomonas sp.]
MIPCGGYFAGYVDDLRRQLKGRQIDLQRARERVHDLSVLDPLTGLTNRGSLVSAVAEEVERGHRLEQPLALILLDLDGFKAINREHGHEVGDRILQQVAESLGERLRAIDTVGRYGGEEFLVALPDMEVREAERQAEALRRRLQRCRLSDEEGMPAITVSVGVAELHEGEGTWDLIGRVRAAADTATERGGDRVVTAEEDRAPTTPG